MSKLTRLGAAIVLGLALGCSLFTSGVFAQSVAPGATGRASYSAVNTPPGTKGILPILSWLQQNNNGWLNFQRQNQHWLDHNWLDNRWDKRLKCTRTPQRYKFAGRWYRGIVIDCEGK